MDGYAAQPLALLDTLNLTSEDVIELGFLSDEDLLLFHKLINNRRPLPIYHDGFWNCFDCPFESEDLQTITNHILKVHKPVSLSNEGLRQTIHKPSTVFQKFPQHNQKDFKKSKSHNRFDLVRNINIEPGNGKSAETRMARASEQSPGTKNTTQTLWSEIFTESEWTELIENLRLPPRQAELLRHVLSAQSDKQIAVEMQISVVGVRAHLRRLFKNFELQDRSELIIYVLCRFREMCRAKGCPRLQ